MSVARHVAAAADPVAAVLEAHDRGELIALRTSGTTSEPRAVVRTTSSWFDSFPHVTQLAGVHRPAGLWLPGPLSATMNLFAAARPRPVSALRRRPGPAPRRHGRRCARRRPARPPHSCAAAGGFNPGGLVRRC